MFIRASLLRALWVTRIDTHRGIDRQLFVLGQFHFSIPDNNQRNAAVNCRICVLNAATTLVVSYPFIFTTGEARLTVHQNS